jgi:hypothetical protein
MRADDFRGIALALPEATESAHMAHPDFRVRGKIFATLGYPDAGHGTAKLTPELQERYMRLYPKAFFPAAGTWGRRGYTVILLAGTTSAIVEPVLAAAWRLTAPKTLAAQHASAQRPSDAGQ